MSLLVLYSYFPMTVTMVTLNLPFVRRSLEHASRLGEIRRAEGGVIARSRRAAIVDVFATASSRNRLNTCLRRDNCIIFSNLVTRPP